MSSAATSAVSGTDGLVALACDVDRYTLGLRLGGIGIQFWPDEGFRLRGSPPLYDEFLADIVSPDIEIAVTATPPPDLGRATCLFDTGATWSLSAEGARRFLSMAPPPYRDRPLWVAATDARYARVNLHCSARLVGRDEGGGYFRNVVQYPLDQLLVIHALTTSNRLLVHAAGAVVRGESEVVVAFPGRSGAGKSTITNLLASQPKFQFLSDDRLLLRTAGGAVTAFGTPWPGDAGIAVNREARLGAMCFLRPSYGARSAIRPLSPSETLARILPVASIPWYEPLLLEPALACVERVIERVPSFELAFRLERDEVAGLVAEVVAGAANAVDAPA